MPTKTKKSKSTKSQHTASPTAAPASSVTIYPSFQALAEAAKNREQFETPPTPPTSPRPRTVRSAADVPRERVEWLWPQRIPLGKVTLLVGDPGLGKTLIATDLAARTSRGMIFPALQPPALPGVCLEQPTRHTESNSAAHDFPANQTHPTANPRQSRGLPSEQTSDSLPHAPCPLLSPPGSVLFLSANDSIADTLRPRLEAHGADLAKIFFADEVHDLRHDLARLEETLDEIPDCRLLVVDPVTAFIGPSDSHYHTIVRKVLAPLAELAERRKIAILAVTHLRKTAGRAIQSAAGSMGFVAAARTVWTVCRDPADPTRNLMLPLKNNLGPLPAGLAYQIESGQDTLSDNDIKSDNDHANTFETAPRIAWQPLPAPKPIEEFFAPPPKPRGPVAEELHQAAEWLRTELAAGPRASFELLQDGLDLGFKTRTLRRALHTIGGHSIKEGFLNGWTWSMEPPPPEKRTSPEETPSEKEVAHTAASAESTTVETPTAPPLSEPPAEHPDLSKEPGPFDDTRPLRENPATEAPPIMPRRPPTLQESIRYLDRLARKRGPATDPSGPELSGPEPPPDPKSLTGHPILDQFLKDFRNDCRTSLQPANKRVSSRAPLATENTELTEAIQQ